MPTEDSGKVLKEIQIRTQLAKEKLQDATKYFVEKANATDIVTSKDQILKSLTEAMKAYDMANEVAVVGYQYGLEVAKEFAGGDSTDGMSAERQKHLEAALKKVKKDEPTPKKRKGDYQGSSWTGGRR